MDRRIRIQHSRPTLGQAEADAAARAIQSGFIAAGPETRQFEKELAAAVHRKGAVATSSGTAALYLALKALDVDAGHEVIIPSYVCTAVLHAVQAAGADPVICDVDTAYNISVESVRSRLSGRTAAIIVPHMFGLPAPIEDIAALGPPVIEDCAQSIGADIGGRPCGSFGVISVFSFYATKMIASGEGGMLASDRLHLVGRVRDLIEYDKKHDPVPRFNLKFNDIAAAVGRVQLGRLHDFVRRRRDLAAVYQAELASVAGISLPPPGPSVYYRYVVETADPAALIAGLASQGIAAARPVDPPLHRLFGSRDCPNTDRAWSRAVSLPLYPSLEAGQAQQIAAAVRELAGAR